MEEQRNVLIITGSHDANSIARDFCIKAGVRDFNAFDSVIQREDFIQIDGDHTKGTFGKLCICSPMYSLQDYVDRGSRIYHYAELTTDICQTFPGARDLPPVGPFAYNGTHLKVDGDTRRVPNHNEYFINLHGKVCKRNISNDALIKDKTHSARRWCLKVAKPEGPFIYEGREYEIDGDERRFPVEDDIFLGEGVFGGYTGATTAEGSVYNISGQDERWLLRPIISDELQAAIDHEATLATALQQATARREELESKK